MTITAETTSPLSRMMKEGSQAEHDAAEASVFMEALVDSRINQAGYAHYLQMFRPVYVAMEEVSEALRDDPIAGAVIDPNLYRLDAIDQDLAYWKQFGDVEIASAAVDAYVKQVHESASWGGLFLAHHYTRYLGDLSGGQAIGRILERTFSLKDKVGIAFYEFDAIEKPKPYKDKYRATLDALDLSAAEKQKVTDEVRATFRLNQAIFDELGTYMDQYANDSQ